MWGCAAAGPAITNIVATTAAQTINNIVRLITFSLFSALLLQSGAGGSILASFRSLA
jgi:hypothetical protein